MTSILRREANLHKRYAIAAHQLSILGQYQNSRDGKLRLRDATGMFEAMKDVLDDN